jgi:hypothetical protein
VTKKFNHYLGRAGHLAIMSEFLIRGWNVAIPEVDIGDDIFVVEDENGTMKRVQVKTSSATIRNKTKTFSPQYQIPVKQLQKISLSPIYYMFIARKADNWTKPLIIPQVQLFDEFVKNNVGTQHKDHINLYFSYSENKVECSGQDFTKYIADYSDFPIIEH